MMPTLHDAKNPLFNTNGLGTLKFTSNNLHDVTNGELTATGVIAESCRLFNQVEAGMFVKLQSSDGVPEDYFVITDVDKTTDSHSATLTMTHYTTLSNNYQLIKPIVATGSTPTTVANQINVNLDRTSPFKFGSNVTTNITVKDVKYQNITPLQVILGGDKSLEKLCGGIVRRVKNTVTLDANNSPKKIDVRLGKNIKGLSYTKSTKGLVTKILPYYLPKVESGQTAVPVYGTPVSSPLINNYGGEIYALAVDYSSRADTLANVNALATSYFTENQGIDKMSVDVSVDLTAYQSGSGVGLRNGDVLRVYYPPYDLTLEIPIYDRTYDFVRHLNMTIKAGNQPSDLFKDLETRLTETQTDLSDLGNTVEDNKTETDKQIDDTNNDLADLGNVVDNNQTNTNNAITNQAQAQKEYTNQVKQQVDAQFTDVQNHLDGVGGTMVYGTTATTAKNGDGTSLKFSGLGLGYYSGNGLLKTAIDNRGNVIADKITGNTLTGVNVNAGVFNGGTFTGNVYINAVNGSQNAVMSPTYGFSTTQSIQASGSLNIGGNATITGDLFANNLQVGHLLYIGVGKQAYLYNQDGNIYRHDGRGDGLV